MIRDTLDPSEHIVWEDKPDKFLYVLGSIQSHLTLIIFAIVSFFIVYFFLGEENAKIMMLFSVGFLLLPVVGIIYRFVNWRHVQYVITDKRIYFVFGTAARDTDLVEFSDVKEPGIFIGYLENSRGKGTIRMSPYSDRSGRRSVTRYANSISHIENPQHVIEIIERQMEFVKKQ